MPSSPLGSLGPVDESVPVLPLAAIEALPAADRAAAYLAVHAELLARLEALPGSA
jgi:hypothetical protein